MINISIIDLPSLGLTIEANFNYRDSIAIARNTIVIVLLLLGYYCDTIAIVPWFNYNIEQGDNSAKTSFNKHFNSAPDRPRKLFEDWHWILVFKWLTYMIREEMLGTLVLQKL